MSHYINILEEGEKYYHSAASTNKSLQIGLGVVAFAVIIGIYSAVTNHYEVINNAETAEQRWTQLESKYNEALERRELLDWVENNDKTLRGWETSRFNWENVLTYLQRHIPEPIDQMQFTSLQFTENMVGLRNAKAHQAGTYPLRRQIQLQLRGIAVGQNGSSQIREFFSSLNRNREKTGFVSTADLQPIRSFTTTDKDSGETSVRHEFTLLIDLNDRPLKP